MVTWSHYMPSPLRKVNVAAAIALRISRWVERFVCCAGGRFSEDSVKEEEDEQRQHGEGGVKPYSSVAVEPDSEPEPVASEAGDDDAGNSAVPLATTDEEADLSTSRRTDEFGRRDLRTTLQDCLPCGAIARAPSLLPMTPLTTRMTVHQAEQVLKTFLNNFATSRSARAHKYRTPLIAHPSTQPTEERSNYTDGDDDQVSDERGRLPSRLRAPRVIPPSPGHSPRSSSSTNSRSRLVVTTVTGIGGCVQPRSPSSSSSSIASSNASRCSSTSSTTSWRDTHSHVVAENAALRMRLDMTPPRVYDFETDPRFMSEQQMRRRAILRHRDALRAKLQQQGENKDGRPQWR